ncbi:39S ribosomal protein L32, mitochondrial [Coccinella septempunctata]|uniref:39S ribosomal protein L32, mitochondrial n=1 Tax=Coccinella septempunctata TaxID=41139 RepID=UPI001D05FDC6|nr:39S ribosomal protein L32, mitochondrial [Coccinella septempunctata]
MVSSLISRLTNSIHKLEQTLHCFLGLNRKFPPDAFNLAVVGIERAAPRKQFSLKDIIGDGFLWAVPKHRRTIEKRLKRKFGNPFYHLKILVPKTNIRVCNTCGDHHEIGILCPTCYNRIMKETKEMRKAIKEKLGLQPVEKEVVVLYENEKSTLEGEFEGQPIVEMKKPRPPWFSKNLLQQTTQQPATTKDVEPSGLS